MREIKFRAWDKINKKFVKINDFMFDDRSILEISTEYLDFGCGANSTAPREEIALMQYTGLKDINKTDIYEGDILDYGDYLRSHVVVFRNGSFWGHAIGYDENIGIGLYNALEDLEVAGNIYDNPELLEVAK